jgi:formate C-acetyltransferase
MDRIQRLIEQRRRQRGACHERDCLFAESLATTSGEPLVLRRAKALAHALDHLTVGIQQDELIVGLHPKREEPLDEPPFEWPRPAPDLSAEQHRAQSAGVYTSGPKTAHLAIDVSKLLRVGLGGLRAEIEEREAATDSTDAVQFLAAARMCVAAASRFVERYRDLAARLAEQATDPDRTAELAETGRVCGAIADGAPTSFREAVQLLWFEYLVRCLELSRSHGAYGLGRIDQALGPFYDRDAADGRITAEAAEELLACLFVKLDGIQDHLSVIAMTIGGAGADGHDACNEVTRLVLRAAARTRAPCLNISFRWHRGVDPETWRLALDTAAAGGAQPAFYSDAVVRASVRHARVSAADAVDALPVGCVELSVQGKTNPWVGNFFNLAKCLELALHGGRDPAHGDQVGPATPPPASFEALLAAYKRHVRHLVELMIDSENKHDAIEMDWRPLPFVSALVADCLASGQHLTAGGARYNFTEVQGVGIANVVDSLMAVKRHVFDQGTGPWDDLLSALRENFDGHEPLRQCLRSRTSHYGTDDPEADALARDVVDHFYACVEGHRNPRGGTVHPGLLVWTLHAEWADATGALPDGRRRGEPLVNSIGPTPGFDRAGPTAVIKSATALDHVPCVGGLTLNLSIHAAGLRTDEGIDRLSELVTTYFERGGMQVQLNAVRREQLLAAQAHPETSPPILVRVTGFSADFLTLSPPIQDEIIRRTEHPVS